VKVVVGRDVTKEIIMERSSHSLPAVSIQDPYIVIVVVAAISHQHAMKELMMMLMLMP
jgi:hypothetical protein